MVVATAVSRSDRPAHVVLKAASLAVAFDEAIHVVHVLTRSEFIDLRLTNTQAEEPKDMGEIRSIAAKMIEGPVSGLDVPYEAVGFAGNPAGEVIGYADGQDVSYIAVNP